MVTSASASGVAKMNTRCMERYITKNKTTAKIYSHPGSKVHGANMGPTWGRQDPGGAHVGPIKVAIWAHAQ